MNSKLPTFKAYVWLVAVHATGKHLRKQLPKKTLFCHLNLVHCRFVPAKSSLSASDIFFQELRHILHHHCNLQLQLGEMFSSGK